MKQTFETAIRTNLYKRSQIDIFVQILQADGGVGSIPLSQSCNNFGHSHLLRALHSSGELAACINASTLALIDAGIAMQDFVVACDAGYLDSTVLLGESYSYSYSVLDVVLLVLTPVPQT